MEQQENKIDQLIEEIKTKEEQVNQLNVNLEEDINNLKKEILKKEMLIDKIKNNNEAK